MIHPRHEQFLRQEDMRKRNNLELEEDPAFHPLEMFGCRALHAAKLTWNLKKGPLKRTVVYGGTPCRFHCSSLLRTSFFD